MSEWMRGFSRSGADELQAFPLQRTVRLPAPMIPITVRHVFDFGPDRALVGDDLIRPEAWDALRTQTDGAFAMAASTDELDAQADARPEIGQRMREVSDYLTAEGIGTVASYGVGGAIAERWLYRHRRPILNMQISDYGAETVGRLRTIFPEVGVREVDILRGPLLASQMHMLHRVDTELSNAQWRDFFRWHRGERFLVIAAEVAGWRRLAAEVRGGLVNPDVSRAGWLRNRAAFEWLWRGTHSHRRVRFHDLWAWDLRPK